MFRKISLLKKNAEKAEEEQREVEDKEEKPELIIAIEKTEVKVAPAPVEVAPEEGISVEVVKKEQGPKEGGKTLGLSGKGEKAEVESTVWPIVLFSLLAFMLLLLSSVRFEVGRASKTYGQDALWLVA